MDVLKPIFSCVVTILLLPIYIVAFVLFLAVWAVFTCSGIGPAIQYCLSARDRKLLDRNAIAKKFNDIHIITIPPNVNIASGDQSYQLVARYSVPENYNPSLPPIALPNGLGATMVLTSVWHEELFRRGYRVLSFDRLGVGFSDDNPTGKPPTAADIVREMDFVMNTFITAASKEKWVLLGGSMGAIVATCYISAFPSKVCGFVNMDGIPYPFHVERPNFLFAAKLYKIYTYIIWTGLFRPFIAMGLDANMRTKLTSNAWDATYISAQLNQTRFFANIGVEMVTMMDLCDFGAAAWGDQDIMKLDADSFDALVRARPYESIIIDDKALIKRQEVQTRSPSERGGEWVDEQAVILAMEKLKSLGNSQQENDQHSTDEASAICVPARVVPRPNLPYVWPTLSVRVMSGRDHDFGNEQMNKFYTQQMKDLAAAEHTVLAKLAANGKRIVYPTTSHNKMFLLVDEVCNMVDEAVQGVYQPIA